jgi:hypothetical protein
MRDIIFSDFLKIIEQRYNLNCDFSDLEKVFEKLNLFFNGIQINDELNIKNQEINYVTDSGHVLEELTKINGNLITFCCNSSILFFEKNKINIDYIFSALSSYCSKFYYLYYLKNNNNLKHLKKILITRNEHLIPEFLNNLKIIERNFYNNQLKEELISTPYRKKIFKIILEKYNNNNNNTFGENLISDKVLKYDFINYNYLFEEYDLSTGMLGLIYLVKMNCKINLYGFTFYLTNDRYHDPIVEEYLIELTKLNSLQSKNAWIHKKEGFKVEQFILLYLLEIGNIVLPDYLSEILLKN